MAREGRANQHIIPFYVREETLSNQRTVFSHGGNGNGLALWCLVRKQSSVFRYETVFGVA